MLDGINGLECNIYYHHWYNSKFIPSTPFLSTSISLIYLYEPSWFRNLAKHSGPYPLSLRRSVQSVVLAYFWSKEIDSLRPITHRDILSLWPWIWWSISFWSTSKMCLHLYILRVCNYEMRTCPRQYCRYGSVLYKGSRPISMFIMCIKYMYGL